MDGGANSKEDDAATEISKKMGKSSRKVKSAPSDSFCQQTSADLLDSSKVGLIPENIFLFELVSGRS